MWAQDSVHSFLPDQVPGRWVGGGGGPPSRRAARGTEPPSLLLPPPSPVFVLLLSCAFGSDKLNLDCVKGELSLAGDSVCCYF